MPVPSIIQKSTLAATFRALTKDGKMPRLYAGRIAKKLVRVCKDHGDYLELKNLQTHIILGTELVEPISLKINGQNVGKTQNTFVDKQTENAQQMIAMVLVWKHLHIDQGNVAPIAFGVIEGLIRTGPVPLFEGSEYNSTRYLHKSCYS